MAVVTVKSTNITNRDSTPRVPNIGAVDRAILRAAKGAAAIANGDSVASKYIMFSLPSNAVLYDVKISTPDIGTTTAGDVGLYRTTADGGAVVDADFIGSAVSLSGGALTKSSILNESAVVTLANAEKRVWEHLGLSADPMVDYDVVVTLTGAADAAGTFELEAVYAV